MKYRNGFVSNSSSSSFIITNVSGESKTWKDFVELVWILEGKKKISNGKTPGKYKGRFTKAQLIKSAYYNWAPNEQIEVEADDEDYENPMSLLRGFFYRHNGDRNDFNWRESNNSQR